MEPKTAVQNQPLLELRNATRIYELGQEKIFALDHVTMSIPKGAYIAIVGPSGSGKSTFANIIGGLDKVDEGEVLVEGVNIAKVNDEILSNYRNKKIGFIFQSFNLMPMYTALENVQIPLVFAKIPLNIRKQRAFESLKAVGLEKWINHKPNQLSGGQRQRVCIARALANNPEIIIADEPTGNLDSKKGQEIIDLLKAINTQFHMTLIIITHDLLVAKQARQIFFMKDGKFYQGDK